MYTGLNDAQVANLEALELAVMARPITTPITEVRADVIDAVVDAFAMQRWSPELYRSVQSDPFTRDMLGQSEPVVIRPSVWSTL